MARYLPRDADFVLAGDDTWDEELPRPRDLDPPWVRRGGRPLAYLLAVALVAGSLLRTTGSDSAPAPAARDAAPVNAPINDLAAQGFTVHAPVAPRDGSSLISDDLSDVCPSGEACRTSTDVPPPLLAALRAAVPGAADVSVRTVTPAGSTSTRMLGRIVHASTALTSITVQVLPGRRPRSAVVTGTGTGVIAVVERPIGTLTVRATVTGVGATARADAPPTRLAADPRMLAAAG